MEDLENKTIKILVLSDIHRNERFWPDSFHSILREHPDIKMILNCGDLAFSTGSDSERASQRDKEYTYTIEIMKTIDQTGIPHYFVPGNHDLEEHFYEGDQHDSQYINMHNRILPHLYLVGYGGSIHAKSMNTSTEWPGYPKDSKDFDYKELKDLFDSVPPEEKFLLILHNPPAQFGTNIAIRLNQNRSTEKEPIYEFMDGGSTVLHDLILHPQYCERIVAVVHGHMHAAQGLNSIGAKLYSPAILNAGPFMHGRYAIMNLIFKNNQWNLKSVTLERISN